MVERIRSADKVLSMVIDNPEKLKSLQENPAEALTTIVEEAKQQTGSPFFPSNIYVLTALALGMIGLIATIGAIILASLGKDAPQVLVALGSAAVGGLVGLLAPKT